MIICIEETIPSTFIFTPLLIQASKRIRFRLAVRRARIASQRGLVE